MSSHARSSSRNASSSAREREVHNGASSANTRCQVSARIGVATHRWTSRSPTTRTRCATSVARRSLGGPGSPSAYVRAMADDDARRHATSSGTRLRRRARLDRAARPRGAGWSRARPGRRGRRARGDGPRRRSPVRISSSAIDRRRSRRGGSVLDELLEALADGRDAAPSRSRSSATATRSTASAPGTRGAAADWVLTGREAARARRPRPPTGCIVAARTPEGSARSCVDAPALRGGRRRWTRPAAAARLVLDETPVDPGRARRRSHRDLASDRRRHRGRARRGARRRVRRVARDGDGLRRSTACSSTSRSRRTR